jgi:ABC-2 type transport system permease protein
VTAAAGPVASPSAATRAPAPSMASILFRLQLAGLRRHWRPYVIVSAVMPAGIVLLVHMVAPHMSNAETAQVVLGDMLLAEAISTIVMLSQQVAWLRQSRALDHYRLLPISEPLFLSILTLCYSLFAWPGVLCIGIEGALLDGLPLSANPLMLPILLLSGVALGGIGALIGLLSPREGLAGLFGNLVMMGILFAGVVPIAGASAWAVWLLRLLPSTYGISLLRDVSLGGTAGSPGDWLALLLYCVAALAAASGAMRRPE